MMVDKSEIEVWVGSPLAAEPYRKLANANTNTNTNTHTNTSTNTNTDTNTN